MSEPIRESGRFSMWQVILACASVAVTSATGSWVLSRAWLGDELEQYRKANSWHVPDAIRELTKLSASVTLSTQDRLRLNDLTSENENLKNQYQAEARKNADMVVEINNLKSRLDALEGDAFELGQGKSRFIVGHTVALGVISSSNVLNSCEVQLGEKRVTLYTGQSMPIGDKGGEVITLMQADFEQCKFVISK